MLALLFEPWFPVIAIAIFFELLWLDSIPAGTYIPPHAQLATVVCASAASLLHLQEPGQILPVLLLGLVIAWAGSKAETVQRRRQSRVHEQLLCETRNNSLAYRPERFVGNALLRHFAIHSALGAVSGILLYTLAMALLPFWSLKGEIGWPILWGAALMGAILALRIRRAYWLLLISAAAAYILLLLLTTGVMPV